MKKEVSNEIKAKLNGKQKKALQVLSKKLDKKYTSDGLFNEFYNIALVVLPLCEIYVILVKARHYYSISVS